jgi:cobalt/nickel transport system permease protein
VHHVELDRWSRGRSLLHARDARVKILLLLAYLAAVATSPRVSVGWLVLYGFPLLAAVLVAGLPVGAVLLRAAVVLPFSAAFAVGSVVAGDSERAAALALKSYLSAAAVLALMGTTPLVRLLRGLERLRVPSFLILVVQFLHRYLFVLSEQAQHMRLAALCRGGWSFRQAAGGVAVLFARSYDRAEGIHQAMLARGFAGRVASPELVRAGWKDWLFLLAGLALVAALRFFLGGVWSR